MKSRALLRHRLVEAALQYCAAADAFELHNSTADDADWFGKAERRLRYSAAAVFAQSPGLRAKYAKEVRP